MDLFRITAARAAVFSLVLLLGACGGGGGGGSPNPPEPPATFTVGGAVSGLAGNSVALRLNGGADFVVTANGSFTFPGAIASGAAYSVTVQAQPTGPAQTCALTNASGTITANVTNIMVNCTTNTYRVNGTLSGLSGGSVVLRNNGGDDLTLSANGPFQFATGIASGSEYAVTVQTQPLSPSQDCVVSHGTGNVVAADITNVTVNCTTNAFLIGGSISGLNGTGLILRNGDNDLAVNSNGPFAFSAPVVSGSNYLVTVVNQPTAPFQRCTVANASGTVLAANITSVTITCVNTYSIGGTVKGLDAAGLILRNSGGDDLTITANDTFSFATRVSPGTPYTVTAVADTPASPRHVCQIVNGTGIAGADVTNIEVTCEADRFAYVAHFSPASITALTANQQTGALTPIAGTSIFATGDGAASIVSDPRGRFIYVANVHANTVSGYRVNAATGALTPLPGSPFAAGSEPRNLAMDSEGQFLYATNTASDNVLGWAIQADGSLSPVPGSPYSTGSATWPISIATSPAGQCCYVYVAHGLGAVGQLSAFAYHSQTGALTPVAGSPYSLPSVYSPSSVVANNTGELVYMAARGTSNLTTFDIAGGIGGGVLTERPGSPTPLGNAPCEIQQPRLSPSLFVVSGLSYQLRLYGDDANALPTLRDVETMFAGSYCGFATDPAGRFVYVPKSDANYLFGFSVDAGGSTLEPLPLNASTPLNTYSLPASQPTAMVLRYNRRDRELLQVAD